MIQPETWKAISEHAEKVWTAAGPLVGVLVGAWLARSWSLKHWKLENRSDECRELLRAIMHSSTLLIDNEGADQPQRKEAYAAYLESLKLLHGRMFIAEDVKKEKMDDKWPNLVGDFVSGKIDAQKFSDGVEEIQVTIIKMVVR